MQRSYKWIEKNKQIQITPYAELYTSLQRIITSELPEEIAIQEEYKCMPGWREITKRLCREGTYWKLDLNVVCGNCQSKMGGKWTGHAWKPYHVHQMVIREQARERACNKCLQPILKFHEITECASCVLAYWEIDSADRGVTIIDVETRFRTRRAMPRTTS